VSGSAATARLCGGAVHKAPDLSLIDPAEPLGGNDKRHAKDWGALARQSSSLAATILPFLVRVSAGQSRIAWTTCPPARVARYAYSYSTTQPYRPLGSGCVDGGGSSAELMGQQVLHQAQFEDLDDEVFEERLAAAHIELRGLAAKAAELEAGIDNVLSQLLSADRNVSVLVGQRL
jgi:hypothetical protein